MVWAELEWAARVRHSEAPELQAMAVPPPGCARWDRAPPNGWAPGSCEKAQRAKEERMEQWARPDAARGLAELEVRSGRVAYRRAEAGEGRKAAL